MSNGISIIWTILPNGFDPQTQRYKISVLVTPRITTSSGGQTLANYPLFADWPTVVKNVTSWGLYFSLPNAPAPVVVRTPDAIGTDGSASALWRTIFPSTTPVAVTSPLGPPQHLANAAAAKIHSFDAASLSIAIAEAYDHASIHHTTRAPILDASRTDPINALVREAQAGTAAVPHLARAFATAPSGATHPTLHAAYRSQTGASGLGYEFARYALFYDRGSHRKKALQNAATRVDLDPPPAPQLPTPDFAQLLGQLADHPAMLRKLGLIIDLEFLPHASVTMGSNAYLALSPIGPDLTRAGATNATPFSVAAIDTGSLRSAQSDAKSMIDGMLPLNDARFTLQTIDTDAAVAAILSLANGQQTGADSEQPLPALRSTGISVLRSDRDAQVEAAITNQTTLQNTFFGTTGNDSAKNLWAEHLVRGYRVDVRRVDPVSGAPLGGYQSLCSRNVTIAVNGATVMQPPADEGYVKGTAGSATDPGTIDLHQSIFGWEGWSLVAPRPGRSITASVDAGTKVQSEGGVAQTNAPTISPLGITVKPAHGSLPQLRFGNGYEFRARLTDLAGNDVSIPSDKGTSTWIAYKRYEPVVAPTLVPQAPFTEGENLERLVIRSDPHGTVAANQHAAGYAPLLANGQAAHPMTAYGATSARWVAAPKGSWALAEAHKRFDGFYAAIAKATDAATLNAAKIQFYNVSLKEAGTFLDTSWVDTSTSASANGVVLAHNAVVDNHGAQHPFPARRGDGLQPGQYVIVPASAPPILPYLPDANAAGVAFNAAALGGVKVRTWGARAGGAWPELAVPAIQLQEGTAIGATGFDGTGAASNTPITVSLPPGAQVDVAYSSTLLDESVMALAKSPVSPDQGQNALLSPSRKLTFVHATQRPPRPSLSLTPQPRAPGQTSITFAAGSVNASGLEADHVDLVASWTEQVDAELGSGVVEGPDGIRTAAHTGRVRTWSLATTDTSMSLATTPVTQQLGDTKHRVISYGAVATSRFREYFPADLVADPTNITNANLVPVIVSIPSSARPPQPKVLYVVPTFKWTTTVSGSTTTRTRAGGGVRIYVDRPWFCSGDGEMLAVLIHAPNDPATNLPEYVSQWGEDPILFAQHQQLAALDASHFVQDPNNPHSDLGSLQLAETGAAVGVLGYAPRFNKDRDAWYFDVELSTDAIDSPFVRLVLARVQWNSIGNLHLSPVVRAEMVKLASDRTATYVTNFDNSVEVTIAGNVFSNEAWAAVPEPDPGTGCDWDVPHCKPHPHPIPKPPPTAYPGYYVNGQASSGHVVTAQVEEATVASPGELDWKAVGATVTLYGYQAGDYWDNATTALFFKGKVPAPAGLAAGAKHRLVIREWEVFEADDQVADANGFVVHNAAGESVKSRSRIVYADVLALPY